ncbi:MAG: class I SAM-dependent methyltransferase [Sphingobacterium sp.]
MLNRKILAAEVQRYLTLHLGENPANVALKKSPFAGISSSELAQQIDGRQRALKKIPEWLRHSGIYFPPKLNLEQSSSMLTGKYKSKLISPGCSLIDLTGGFGVDSYYFAAVADSVTHCEINTALSEIVEHNFKTLALKNIVCLAQDGIASLRHATGTFDYIYLDPSRRVESRKVFRLQDCLPNVCDHQSLFFKKSDTIITKLAPLLDISLTLESLQHVASVYVLSVENDCKELLIVQQKGFTQEPTIHAVLLGKGETREFTFKSSVEKNLTLDYSAPQSYLYDPDVAITKSGAFKSVAVKFNVSKLEASTHLYTSSVLQSDFPGRKFKILETLHLKELKKMRDITQANVVAKNFPLKVEAIRKKYKIKDGGPQYLYFCTLASGNMVVVRCERLPEES